MRRITTVVLSAVTIGGAALAVAGPASASPSDGSLALSGSGGVTLHRGDPARAATLRLRHAAEVSFDASARGADWSREGAEAAVVSIAVDGHHQTDVVIPFADPQRRSYGLGLLAAGRHRVSATFSDEASAPRVRSATLSRIRVHAVRPSWRDPHDADWLAAHYAPVLQGRSLPDLGGPLGNAVTDTPLVAWHEITPAETPGHVLLQVSYIWSNEDGGTDTARLMARWGRTTDIEWIYRVEIDADGNRVPGSDTFQAPEHTTTTFRGRYEGGSHAVLETCTENNNVCDTGDDPMRFTLSAQQGLPAGSPREAVMDANPWTYQVMAAEMRREGKLEPAASPATSAVSDQRNYLFAAFDKDTSAANQGDNWIGVSLAVRLRGDKALYRSDHIGTGGAPDWSIQRDDPAATTVELPRGTTARDVESISVIRVVHGTDPGTSARVTRLIRGFFLDRSYLPGRSFLAWTGSTTLTADRPTAVIWSRSRNQ